MNLSLTTKKIKDSLLSLLDRDKENLAITANRDWVISLSVFFLLILISAGLGMYLFSKINKGEIFAASEEKVVIPQTITKENLWKSLFTYDEKKRVFEERVKTRPRIIDPSL